MTPEKNNSVKNEVNKINSKIAKSVFRISLAGSILLGSSACVPIDSIIVTPAPEVSPLPSESTKTPILLPTESPIELTPTVVNTATQELTLVSPTEVATEIATPEDFVTVEFKSENLEENIKAWQEGRIDYKLMEVTEEGWGKGLGLIFDAEKEKVTSSEEVNEYYFQGVYLGYETIKLMMSEEMANPENISLPDEYINNPYLKENILVTFNKMADRVIDGFPDGADYTVVFVGMENGLVVPLSMGYEVEGKDFIKEALPAVKSPDITDGKFPDRFDLPFLTTMLIKPSTSFVDVKVGQAIAFESREYTKYGLAKYLNIIDSKPTPFYLNFLAIVSGMNSNLLEMVNGNFDILAVNSDENITWQRLYTLPKITQYFISK